MDTKLFSPHLMNRLQILVTVLAVSGIVIACVVLFGWLFNIASFKTLLPNLANMKFNTALAFTALGSGLLLVRKQPVLAQLLSAIVVVLGLLTLAQYIFAWNLGIDELFVRDIGSIQTLYPGRISPIAAFLFGLTGLSLWLTARFRYLALAQLVALGVVFLALLSLAGYLYGVEAFYQISASSSIALHTAVTFMLLGVGVFLVYPEQGLAAWIAMNRAGGHMARRLLPLVIILPLTLAWIRLKGQEAGLYDTAFGLALVTFSDVVVFTGLVFWTARSLNRVDNEREAAVQALWQTLNQLELRVQERTEQLRQSEEKFAKAFHASPAAVSIASLPDGRWLEINDALTKIAGYSREEALGHTSLELGLIDERARAKILEAIREHGAVRNVEIEVHTKSGAIAHLLLSSEKIQLNGQDCALNIQYDITAQKQAEAAVKAKMEEEREFLNYLKALQDIIIELANINPLDAFYKRAVELGLQRLGFERLGLLLYEARESLAIGTYGTDAKGNLVAEHHLRFHPAELTNILMRALQHDAHFVLDETAELYSNLEPIGNGWNAAAVLWNGIDKLGWLLADNGVQHKPISRPQLEILALYALSLGSLLAQKRAQKQAFEMALEKERVTLLNQFIQDSSHEFRTPLTIILTSLYVMNKSDDGERRQAKARIIEEQIERITKLVDMLVILSHLDSGLPCSFALLDLNHLVADIYDTMRGRFSGKDLSVSLELDEHLPHIPLDEGHIREAIQQILDNALQFTAAGGSIWIATRRDAAHVKILIRDTGSGIPEAALPHIFERFYRQDVAHSTPGFGLGLPIARAIVQRHGGDIRVETSLGAGSTFEIALPIEQASINHR